MHLGGKFHRAILWLKIIAVGLFVVLPFQNCALEGNNSLSNKATDRKSDDCLSTLVDCGPNPEFLEISLDMKDPTVLPDGSTEIDYAGRCNSGNYIQHYIRVTILDASNTVVVQRDDYDICNNGVYIAKVDITGFTTNVLYTLKVQMVGVEGGSSYTNFNPTGEDQLDFHIYEP